VFVLGKPLLQGKGEPPDVDRIKKPLLGPINIEWSIYLFGLIGVGIVWVVVQQHDWVGYMLAVASVIVLGYLLVYMITSCTFVEAQRMILALILIGASVVFWTLFEQAGSSLNQFAERNTNLTVGKTTIAAAQT